MVMSALSAPIYARSLMDTVLRRKSKFVVTPKGDSASPDTLFGTFRIHLFFILVFGGSIAAGLTLGHSHPAMITWATFALLITASPIFAWRYALRKAKKQPPTPGLPQQQGPGAPAPAHQPQPAQYAPHGQYAPHAPYGQHGQHGSGHKPSWAASGSGTGSAQGSAAPDAGNDQTMQIALGGFGGRKE
jgi:hypothetical protein